MEKLIKTTAKGFDHLFELRERFLFHWNMKTTTQFIGFILILLILPAILAISFLNLSFLESDILKTLIFAGYLLLAFVLLIIVAAYYQSKGSRKTYYYGIKFKTWKSNKINYSSLYFNKEEERDFKRLLSGRKVENKINFKIPNLSKQSANHRTLFFILHILSQNGLNDLSTEERKGFFNLVEDSFLMNGQPINPGTLESSFSSWKKELESEKSQKSIEDIQRMMNL